MLNCSQHPGASATASCVGCRLPVCDACREDVAGHPMCRQCMQEAQARLSTTAAPSPVNPSGPAAPAAVWPGGVAQPVVPPPAAPGTASAPVVELPAGTPAAPLAEPLSPCGPLQYLKAFLFAAIAAVICAVIWDKIVLWSGGWQIGFVVVILGVIVGIAVRTGAEGRPGPLLPFIGALMTGFAILLGYILLANDQILKDPASAQSYAKVPFVIRAPLLAFVVVQNLDLMSWVFVAIGVWQGWSIPRKANAEAA